MKIAVIGEICNDVFIEGVVRRLCPEAPTAILRVPENARENAKEQKGMAWNVANNVAGMGVTPFKMPRGYAGTKIRYIDSESGYLLLRVDEDKKPARLTFEDRLAFLNTINTDPEIKALIVSDYNKGFLAEEDLHALAICSTVPTFLDTKKALTGKFVHDYDIIKVNEAEWQRSAKAGYPYNGDNLIVTYGAGGCIYQEKQYRPTEVSHVRSVSGAGDTFIAALAVEYCRSQCYMKAIQYALKCAGEVVKHPGTTIYEETCQRRKQSLSQEPLDS